LTKKEKRRRRLSRIIGLTGRFVPRDPEGKVVMTMAIEDRP
jgi:hypothetical protein